MDQKFVFENLIFMDDLMASEDSLSTVESVGLVDFNQLNKELESKLESKVHYIVDHHNDNKLYLNTLKEK